MKVYSSQYLKEFPSDKEAQKTWETLRDMYRRELKKLHNKKSGQTAGTTHESKWQYFTSVPFVNAVMIPRPTLSNVPVAEESFLGSTQNFEGGNDSTNVLINDSDNDEFSEGVSDECQVKKNLGTKRKINFQQEVLHLEQRKVKLMEERLMKKSQADEDKDYMFLMRLLPCIKEKLDDIQRLELGMEFLSSVTRRFFHSLLIVFPQHLTVRALQVHPLVQQVSIQHIPRIQTHQHTHCRCLARIYATSVSSSILRTYKGVPYC